ncbi:MAG: methionine--tRNA ligase subunit beta [Candidatus Aenigmatarchaeota archaeon]
MGKSATENRKSATEIRTILKMVKMESISFEDWKKTEIRVGRILEAEKIPKTKKLYMLQIDIGREKPVQIVTSLVPYYTEEELKNQKIIVLMNLKPSKFGGEISEGMLLCAEKDDGSECVLLTVQKDIETGTLIK